MEELCKAALAYRIRCIKRYGIHCICKEIVCGSAVISCVICPGASKLLSTKLSNVIAGVTSVLREYHIFEMFPDGSSLWRARIGGRFNSERKLQELAEHSESEFVAIDFSTSHFLWSRAHASKPLPKIENVRSIDTVKASSLSPSTGTRTHTALAQSERRSHGS
jgi:hypothetical protein